MNVDRFIHHDYKIQAKNIEGHTLLDLNNVVGIITINILGSLKISLINTVLKYRILIIV